MQGATVHLDATLHDRIHMSEDSFRPFQKLAVLISALTFTQLWMLLTACLDITNPSSSHPSTMGFKMHKTDPWFLRL
jgi:hypothetical protein